MAPCFHLSLADSKQVIEEDVTVMDLELQSVTLLCTEVGEILLPPGVLVVIANSCFTQTGRATEDCDIAIGGSQEIGGKVTGSQVEHPQLGISHAQTAQDQQEERNVGGHGVQEGCVGGAGHRFKHHKGQCLSQMHSTHIKLSSSFSNGETLESKTFNRRYLRKDNAKTAIDLSVYAPNCSSEMAVILYFG